MRVTVGASGPYSQAGSLLRSRDQGIKRRCSKSWCIRRIRLAVRGHPCPQRQREEDRASERG